MRPNISTLRTVTSFPVAPTAGGRACAGCGATGRQSWPCYSGVKCARPGPRQKRLQDTGASGYGNIWCAESALCVGDGVRCQLGGPTGTFHQLGLWHSFVGHKSPKPSHLELQDSHGSPRGPDKGSTLANMQAFSLVYTHYKIMHRPQNSTPAHLNQP